MLKGDRTAYISQNKYGRCSFFAGTPSFYWTHHLRPGLYEEIVARPDTAICRVFVDVEGDRVWWLCRGEFRVENEGYSPFELMDFIDEERERA